MTATRRSRIESATAAAARAGRRTAGGEVGGLGGAARAPAPAADVLERLGEQQAPLERGAHPLGELFRRFVADDLAVGLHLGERAAQLPAPFANHVARLGSQLRSGASPQRSAAPCCRSGGTAGSSRSGLLEDGLDWRRCVAVAVDALGGDVHHPLARGEFGVRCWRLPRHG